MLAGRQGYIYGGSIMSPSKVDLNDDSEKYVKDTNIVDIFVLITQTSAKVNIYVN